MIKEKLEIFLLYYGEEPSADEIVNRFDVKKGDEENLK